MQISIWLFVAMTIVAIVTVIRNIYLIHLLHQDGLTQTLNTRGWQRIKRKIHWDLQIINIIYALNPFSHHHRDTPKEKRVICLDLDFFKQINDTYNHEVGDHALKVFANALKEATRSYDSIFRKGGDEFAIIAHTRRGGEIAIANRLISAIRACKIEGYEGINITASIGISGPLDKLAQDPLQQAYREADKASLEAKTLGRNRFVFFEDLEKA